MYSQNRKAKSDKKWLKKLAFFVAITSVTTLISFPVIARYFPRYALFQPYAYSNYPYRSGSNIADTLAKDSKFANLVDELKEAGLLESLKQPSCKGCLTIFAPTNQAFNALPDAVFKKYSQPKNRVKVLKYHLVSGQISRKNIDDGSIKTLEGNPVKITFNSDGTVNLNNANAKQPSTVTENGVIIEINQVLLPPDF